MTTNDAGPKIAPTGYWLGDTAHSHHDCCQPLALWIARLFIRRAQQNTPVYDFGCGMGAYLRVLSGWGFTKVMGFEGEPPLGHREDVRKQDLTKRFDVPERGNVICLEVAEHIPAEFESMLVDNIDRACSGTLCLSWAIRGQVGDGHVNCRDNSEVRAIFEARGFRYNEAESNGGRATPDPDWCAHFTKTFMVFDRG